MAEGLIHRRFLPACVKDARALACQQQRAYAPRVCFQKALVVRAGDDVGVFVVSLFLIKAGGKILRVRVDRDGEQRVVLRLKIIAEREAVRRQLIDQRGKNLFIGLLPVDAQLAAHAEIKFAVVVGMDADARDIRVRQFGEKQLSGCGRVVRCGAV